MGVVNEIHLYQGVCMVCSWWGDRLESEDAAAEDVAEHNAENHGAQADSD